MIVLQSTYDKLHAEHFALLFKHRDLVRDWNSLVELVNAKGGLQALKMRGESTQFSSDDIKRLLVLCHPDKHDGKQLAHDMTKKLLALRESIK